MKAARKQAATHVPEFKPKEFKPLTSNTGPEEQSVSVQSAPKSKKSVRSKKSRASLAMKKRLSGSRTAEVRSKKSTKSKKKKPVGQTATFGKPQSGNMEDIALYVRKSGKAQELLEILTSQIQEEQSQLSHQIDEAAPGSKGIFKKKNQPATTGQKVQINAPIKLQNNYIPQQG